MQDQDAVDLLKAIREHSGLELSTIRGVCGPGHGADAGYGGFTYYSDTSEFYESNRELLWRILSEDAEEFGFDNVPAFVASFNNASMANTEEGFECLVSWYALEQMSFWLQMRREEAAS